MAITGVVQNRRAVIPVTLRYPGRPDLRLEFQVDTSFPGELALPPDAVEALELPFVESIPAVLADGSHDSLELYDAVILWHEGERMVQVLATGVYPRIGAALLEGSLLGIEYWEGGAVVITPSKP